MTKIETIAAIKVMQAYVDGADIQIFLQGEWEDRIDTSPAWQWNYYDYRIKPKQPLIGSLMTYPNNKDEGLLVSKFGIINAIQLTDEVKEALEAAGITYE